jgi:hypothetical protein
MTTKSQLIFFTLRYFSGNNKNGWIKITQKLFKIANGQPCGLAIVCESIRQLAALNVGCWRLLAEQPAVRKRTTLGENAHVRSPLVRTGKGH